MAVISRYRFFSQLPTHSIHFCISCYDEQPQAPLFRTRPQREHISTLFFLLPALSTRLALLHANDVCDGSPRRRSGFLLPVLQLGRLIRFPFDSTHDGRRHGENDASGTCTILLVSST